ncbi:hypothetical protein IU486_21530 [Streptomyces gardneri]|uniref:hypothetical protein n=1 Tax=Nocardia TaxID=1817 RepID=UPI001358B35D|nr:MULTISPECIES: hypothetical protein [Nocardia]MBF6167314.1 hypothetical protein [Streptomyces gardneri]MBF6204599.1 hypothetical protein [Streptomyces gardneri]UAK33079.1 hypothetical protein K8O92_03515 [Nocardia asteroides]
MAETEKKNTTESRGPAASLLIAGLLSLAVSVWAFAGPASWPAASMIPIGWIVVLAAIVIGIALVISPRKRP